MDTVEDGIRANLNTLAAKRYISMTLHYLEDGDKGFQAKGFEPSTSSQLRFPTADGWERTSSEVDELPSAFHRYYYNCSSTDQH